VLRLADSPWLAGRRVAVIDPRPLSGRHWCYWGPGSVSPADDATWDRLRVRDESGAIDIPLRRNRYRSLSGDRLQQLVDEALRHSEFLDLRGTSVTNSGDDGHLSLANGDSLHAHQILDSRSARAPGGSALLSFAGITIAGPPGPVTLMDLTVDQPGNGVAFGYRVPRASGTLVELACFSAGAPDSQPEHILRSWAESAAPLTEQSSYPLQFAGPRRIGRRLLIGRRAGVLRASTGYATVPLARDAAAIVASLERSGTAEPARPSALHTRLDQAFLRLLGSDPRTLRQAYGRLFRQCDPDTLLDFLNDRGGVRAALAVGSALPMGPFAAALTR
jgi:lycopene beta-cyclase